MAKPTQQARLLPGDHDVGLGVAQRLDVGVDLGWGVVAIGVGGQRRDQLVTRDDALGAGRGALEQLLDAAGAQTEEAAEVAISFEEPLVHLGGAEVPEGDVAQG